MGHILSHPIQSKLLQRRGDKNYRIGAAEMQGYRASMEDRHTLELKLSDKHPDLSFFAVFDGHSGVQAAIYLKENLHLRVAELKDPLNDKEEMKRTIVNLDQEFMKNTEVRSHGSTACFAVVKAEKNDSKPTKYLITVGNVGDSRAMIINPKDKSVRCLTTDHKPDDPPEAQRIRAAGGKVNFGRVDGELAMSRSIGDWNYKGNSDLKPEEQKVSSEPDVIQATATEGEFLLICCDGLVEKLSNEQLAAFISDEAKALVEGKTQTDTGINQSSKPIKDTPPIVKPSAQPLSGLDPAYILHRLLDYSLISGSKDNMSALLICLTDGSDFNYHDEYVAGPFLEAADDRKFAETYKQDAARHGIQVADLMAVVKSQASSQGMDLSQDDSSLDFDE